MTSKNNKAKLKKENRNRDLVILGRVFNHGLRNLIRNVWLTSAATAVMAVALAILLASSILNMALGETIDERTQDFSVGIYLNDGVDQNLLADLRSELESQDYVSSVTFISKEEARQIFEQQYADEDFVREGLDLTGADILPASFDVRFSNLEYVEEVVAIAESEKFSSAVYRTSDNKLRSESINQYLSIQSNISRGSVVAVVLFSVIAALIVFNTIRMAVFSRTQEIEIMKLIGATPGYIRGPFLVEASLYGVVAGMVAFSLVYSLMQSLLPGVSSLRTIDTVNFFSSNWYLVLLAVLVAGILIGLISSWLATAKYLKLKRW